MKKWKLLIRTFDNSMLEALQEQHHAAQFIAMAGRHLIPQQPDDSNTNMEFLTDTGLLAGHELVKGVRLALHLSEMKFCILTPSGCAHEVPLAGKTKQEVFEEIKNMLVEAGVNTARLKYELHYEIPEHPLDKGAVFTMEDPQAYRKNMLHRHNAQIILEVIIKDYAGAEPVRIWPHHFDTGTLIPLERNVRGELIKSMGLGWAIPDTMVRGPYFYLSYWSEESAGPPDDLPAPGRGRWMIPDWNVAVLLLSRLLEADTSQGQHALAKEFFR